MCVTFVPLALVSSPVFPTKLQSTLTEAMQASDFTWTVTQLRGKSDLHLPEGVLFSSMTSPNLLLAVSYACFL